MKAHAAPTISLLIIAYIAFLARATRHRLKDTRAAYAPSPAPFKHDCAVNFQPSGPPRYAEAGES
jgi:hypothetical protein